MDISCYVLFPVHPPPTPPDTPRHTPHTHTDANSCTRRNRHRCKCKQRQNHRDTRTKTNKRICFQFVQCQSSTSALLAICVRLLAYVCVWGGVRQFCAYLRTIELHDPIDFREVEATSGHVSCKQHCLLARAEVHEYLHAVVESGLQSLLARKYEITRQRPDLRARLFVCVFTTRTHAPTHANIRAHGHTHTHERQERPGDASPA